LGGRLLPPLPLRLRSAVVVVVAAVLLLLVTLEAAIEVTPYRLAEARPRDGLAAGACFASALTVLRPTTLTWPGLPGAFTPPPMLALRRRAGGTEGCAAAELPAATLLERRRGCCCCCCLSELAGRAPDV